MSSKTYLITIIALGLILFGCLGQPAESIVDSATTPTTETTTEPSKKPVATTATDSVVGCWSTTIALFNAEIQLDFSSDGTIVTSSSSDSISGSSGAWKRISDTLIETTFEDGTKSELIQDEAAGVLLHEAQGIEYKKSECIQAPVELVLCDVLTLDEVNSIVPFTLTKSVKNPNTPSPSCLYSSDESSGIVSFQQLRYTIDVVKDQYKDAGATLTDVTAIGDSAFISYNKYSVSYTVRTIDFQKSGAVYEIRGEIDRKPLTEDQLKSLASAAVENLE